MSIREKTAPSYQVISCLTLSDIEVRLLSPSAGNCKNQESFIKQYITVLPHMISPGTKFKIRSDFFLVKTKLKE